MQTSNQIISENRSRVYLYMLVLFVILVGFGYLLGSYLGHGLTAAGIALIIAGVINIVAYFFSDKIVLMTSGAEPMTREMSPEYYAMVEKLALKANLPMPKLYLIDDPSMNAFATGRDHKHAVVAVTRGLLEKLEMDEVEGVVAHELSHIKHYDMRLMAVISILAGCISIMTDMLWYGSSRSNREDRSGVGTWIGFLAIIVAPITVWLIQLAISRRREYMADAQGAKLVGSGRPLATALAKISGDPHALRYASYATAHMYISNPFKDNWLEGIISTHPPVKERIEKLKALVF